MDPPRTGTMGSGPKVANEDEDLNAEADEPPEQVSKLNFAKIGQSDLDDTSHSSELVLSPHARKASLLTQALLTSPELTPLSDSEATLLMSDGGNTSPTRTATPSPPVSFAKEPKESTEGKLHIPPVSNESINKMEQPAQSRLPPVSAVEEALGRKRCISFACGKKMAFENAPDPQPLKQTIAKPAEADGPPARRPCTLRFACPTKPARVENHLGEARRSNPDTAHNDSSQNGLHSRSHCGQTSPVHLTDAKASSKNVPLEPRPNHVSSEATHIQPVKQPFNRIDFQKSEATSFHEFAGPYPSEDEWTHEQIAYKQKLTIEDTLGKENAIRRLAAEAEAEALEEEGGGQEREDKEPEGLEDDSDEDPNDESGAEGRRSILAASDDGNESDDEGGFAESDDGSDEGLGYQFWTPGVTTAATSTEHLEHLRPLTDRVASDSSLEVEEQLKNKRNSRGSFGHRSRAPNRTTKTLSGTGETKFEDFIVGTLDEDRPQHDAYVSSFEQRKRSKRRVIPQDIDPSFPTSDPDDEEEDGNESEDEETDDNSGEEDQPMTTQESVTDEKDISPRPCTHGLDKRLRDSPRQGVQNRSPAPKHMFGNMHHRLRSPAPFARRIISPPPSRRPSPPSGPSKAENQIPVVTHLAQRPGLIRTASLPRSEKPFWGPNRFRSPREDRRGGKTHLHTVRDADVELHPRGPIDIVQGLEHKRLRRKEKYWRLHCQKAHAGKEKERKCQRGKGVQRMAEVGKEMQDRFKAYGHNRPNLMLSI